MSSGRFGVVCGPWLLVGCSPVAILSPRAGRISFWSDRRCSVGDHDRIVYRFKTRYVVLELGFLLPCYAALRYSLISPPSTFRRRIRPSIGVTARSS
jgi:hypothetical protein